MANEIEAAYLFALMILANVQSIENNNIRHTLSIIILILTYGFGGIFFTVKAIRFFPKFVRKRREQLKLQSVRRQSPIGQDNMAHQSENSSASVVVNPQNENSIASVVENPSTHDTAKLVPSGCS